MPALRLVLTAAVACAVLAACGGDEKPAEPTACGMIGFTPQTDDGAFDIQATGVGCATAKQVARATRDRRVSDPLSFSAEGFACTGERTPSDALPGVAWRCERDGAVVTFTRN